MHIEIDRDRFITAMREQADIGATDGGGLHRLALSDADREIRDWFYRQLETAGLEVRVDAFGNMFGRREGTDPDAAPILLGSHLDSQPYGGIYDGALGVIAALEIVRTLNDQEIDTRHPIEIVNWTNEEGARFQPSMQGSGVWTGTHDIQTEYAKTDTDGVTVEDELERIGYKGDVPAEPREEYESYLELHIEQGPYLDDAEADIGVVTGIVGMTSGEVTFHGQADHAGPTPMHARSDALVAGADLITSIRRLPTRLGERTVSTVGNITVAPNSINVIPGKATVTWDCRDSSDAIIRRCLQGVRREARLAAEREGVSWDWNEHATTPSVAFADRCIKAIQSAVDRCEYDAMALESGAGHDAIHMPSVCDTGMVFAVSENGTSHSEQEYTSWDDCERAANVLANATINISYK